MGRPLLLFVAALCAGCFLDTDALRAPADAGGTEGADEEPPNEGGDEGAEKAPPDEGGDDGAGELPTGEGAGEGEGEEAQDVPPQEGAGQEGDGGEDAQEGAEGEGGVEANEGVGEGEPGEGEGEGEGPVPCGRLADELGTADRWVSAGDIRDDANGSQECPFGGLAQALASLPPEGPAVVHLESGEYPGGLTLNRPGLTLRSVEEGGAVLRGAGATGRVLAVASERVSIEGLTLAGGAVGVFLEGVADTTLSALTIRDLRGFGGTDADPQAAAQATGGVGGDAVGIWAQGANDISISGVTIRGLRGGAGGAGGPDGGTGGGGGSAIGLRFAAGGQDAMLRELLVGDLQPGAPGEGGEGAPDGIAGGKIAIWADNLRALDVDDSLTYAEGDLEEPIVLVIGRLPEGGGKPVGCRSVEGLDLTLSFSPFAPATGRIIVMDCPDVVVGDNSLANSLGTPGAPAGESGVGGSAPPVVGIRIDGCGGAIIRGNDLRLLRPGDGAPGARGGLGGRGGGIEAIVVSNSPRSKLLDNRVTLLFGGANGLPGVGGPGSQPAGLIAGLRLVRSVGVKIDNLDIGILFGADAAVGIDLEASQAAMEHVLIYDMQGLRLADGVALDSQSSATLRLSTLAAISSQPGLGSAVSARVGGEFRIRWTLVHDSPRLYAEDGGTGIVEDSLISEPAFGHPEVQNVETRGAILRDAPTFVRPRDGDYHLAAGSPGVDEGSDDPSDCSNEPEGEDCVLDWGRYGNTPESTPSE